MGIKDILLALVGLLLVLIGIKGRIWTILYLRAHAGNLFVTHGPYARCRHPLYFYNLLGATGIAAASGMATVVIGTLLTILLFQMFLIRKEERKLLLTCNEDYIRYRSEVPLLWPSGTGKAESEPCLIGHAEFRHAFWDASGFLAGWILVFTVQLYRGANCGSP